MKNVHTDKLAQTPDEGNFCDKHGRADKPAILEGVCFSLPEQTESLIVIHVVREHTEVDKGITFEPVSSYTIEY